MEKVGEAVSYSSLHSILSNISSHASDLAINACSHLIEDQIADPEKLEKNLVRVKSMFLRDGEGAGDCPPFEETYLLTLPRKVRQVIWSHLDDNTIKTLRLVCEQLRYEMDYDVGLAIVLKPESFSNIWMRSLTVRSCYIRKLTNILSLNNLARPEKLQRLSFHPDIQVDIDMLELVMRKFMNLKQMVVYTEDVVEIKNLAEDPTSHLKYNSSAIITRLEDQFQLTSIDVKFDTSKWKLKWSIKLKPQTCDNLWRVADVMGPFGFSGMAPVKLSKLRDLHATKTLTCVTISIPFVQDRDRFVWLKLLQTQTALISLTCDLNATHWKDYKAIIYANKKSLQKLFLLNITCSQTRCMITPPPDELDCPLDWTMFQGCGALKDITLIAETFLGSSSTQFGMSTENLIPNKKRRYISSVNLDSLNCALTSVWLENFKFNLDQVNFLKGSDSPRFDHCTLKNCKLVLEEVSEAHLGRVKERNRNLEYFCFGTTFYDDEEIDKLDQTGREKTADNFLKRTINELNFIGQGDISSMSCYPLQSTQTDDEDENNHTIISQENVNILGGLVFTVWLYFI